MLALFTMTMVKITPDPTDLLLSSYDYFLPLNLIAQRPLKNRSDSKLLVYKKQSGELIHDNFKNINLYLPKNSALILNETKVLPSRILGFKETGGEAEIFILEILTKTTAKCLLKCSGTKREGQKFIVADTFAHLLEIEGDGTFILEFKVNSLEDFLESFGLLPIPPYIRNGLSDEQDKVDYQTVFSKNLGSVAAPTAGLHFSKNLLSELNILGHATIPVTLHVGLGTFAKVSEEKILDHKMHYEKFYITKNSFDSLKANFGNLIPVGTTALRTLQSLITNQILDDHKCEKNLETNIFLHPGSEIFGISGLITNFHLPKSTLLMLVSSLIGRKITLEIYKEAIHHQYRFFSYGDAMLILL